MWGWLTTRLPGLRRLFVLFRRSRDVTEQAHQSADRADQLIDDYRRIPRDAYRHD